MSLGDTPYAKRFCDIGNRSSSAYVGLSTLTKKWKFLTAASNGIGIPVLGSDGTIYLPARDDGLYAINPDGSEKWHYTDRYAGRIAISSDGYLYVTDGTNKGVYKIDTNKNYQWYYQLNASGALIYCPTIAPDGTIYAVQHQDNLYAINPNGTEKWTKTYGDNGPAGEPVIDTNGIIYVQGTGYTDYIFAINPSDGSEKWKYAEEGNDHWHPITLSVDNGILFWMGYAHKYFYAIYVSGALKYRYTESYTLQNPAAILPDNNLVFIIQAGAGYVVISSEDGSLMHIKAYGDSYLGAAQPIVDKDGKIYIPVYKSGAMSKLMCFLEDGTFIDEFLIEETDVRFELPVIADDGTLYVSTDGQYLYALGAVPPPKPINRIFNKPGFFSKVKQI